MNKNSLKYFLSVVFCFALLFCGTKLVFAAQTVDFTFSKNSVVFQKDKNNKPMVQMPMVVPKGVAKPEKVSGYTVKYSRTHKGNGERIATAEKAITSPTQAGTYTAIITFTEDAGYKFSNGTFEKQYPAALTIRRASQETPILRSGSQTLVEQVGVEGGTIAAGEFGVISTSWSSGIKPIYTWSLGSLSVVTPETGKPARFVAKSEGTAILNVTIPEDNNHSASAVARYVVNVGNSGASPNGLYYIDGKKSTNGWYVSDVTIVAKNGFTKVLPDTSNPITTDGITNINFSLATDTGDATETFSETIKKDSTGPVIDNVTINDSPFFEAPEDDVNAWAGATNMEIKADVFDSASGIAKVEYRVDGQDYISVADTAFLKEGTESYVFMHTLEGAGHTLFLKATDHAGNVSVRDFSIKDETTTPIPEEIPPTIEETPPQNTPVKEVIETPTEAMEAVLKRLNYLNLNNIEAKVKGDVRANQGYVEETLTMFTALRPAEREALGEEKLLAFRAFFEMLYTVTNKDIAQLEPLFVFEPEPQPTPPAVSSSSLAQSVSQPQSESASQSQSESISQSSSAVAAQKPQTPPFSAVYLIPVVFCIAGFVVYFMWQKKLKTPKTKFVILQNKGQNEPPKQEDYPFGGFDDMDE